MIVYRYGATLRPWAQLNLKRLQVCDDGWRPDHGSPFAFGTATFHRALTAFETSQFDVTFVGVETCIHAPRYG